jgi:WXG100 family type VII secretion target
MAPRIRAHYGDLGQARDAMHSEADTVVQMTAHLKARIGDLHAKNWTGQGSDAFFREMEQTILPAMKRLSTALEQNGQVMGAISRIFQEADQDVVALFRNGLNGMNGAGDAAGDMGSDGAAKNADLSKIVNGVNGWSVISHDGSQGFDTKELVSQIGNTCALYAPLNLLIESGYDVSQITADTYVSIKKIEERSWLGTLLNLDNGFDMDASEHVLDDFKANYKSGNFLEVTMPEHWWESMKVGPNQAKAEKFLIDTVKNGQPVLVSMEMDDSFGSGGGHRATVVGVQTGADGKLQNVLVATNWSGSSVMEVPAAAFMDDWMNRKNGAYITIDRAPAPPPKPEHSFSKDLLEELNKSGSK